ncbi:MAG: hypothetical protein ACJAXS_002921 [Colwellia sp.]|jgi:hypothetical protein
MLTVERICNSYQVHIDLNMMLLNVRLLNVRLLTVRFFIDVFPISFMSRSISARISPNDRSTPFCSAEASGHKRLRPIPKA